jgi:hypothetical protein
MMVLAVRSQNQVSAPRWSRHCSYHLEKGGKRLHIVETAHLIRLADLQKYGAFQMAGKIGASTRHFDYHTHVHSQDSYHLEKGGKRLHVVEMAPCR